MLLYLKILTEDPYARIILRKHMEVKIIVATHKEYQLMEDDRYLPIFVGAAVSKYDLPYQRDDEGENISEKNKYYSELTGLYWAYKNLKADYIGLCHYHRYFDLRNIIIEDHEIILPKKRKYYIETIYDQYRHAHGREGLDTAREIIKKYHHDYLEYFDKHMTETSEHNCNMFIMKHEIFVDYCDFLFDVLFKVEEKLGNIDRLYGYISERLLDVYINKNGYEYKEVKVIETGHINWPKKIYEFIKRKYTND